MNTGGPAFPVPDSHHANGQVQYGSNGMTLLDWMAGQALAGLCSSWYDRHKDDPETQRGHGPALISQSAYTHAEAMLAEKARREEDHPEDKLGKDHSPDANKTVPSQSALIRSGWDLFTWADKTMDETDECRVFLHNWREAVRCQPEDHSPDAGKMTEINLELVEALDAIVLRAENPALCDDTDALLIKSRAVLAKAKGVA